MSIFFLLNFSKLKLLIWVPKTFVGCLSEYSYAFGAYTTTWQHLHMSLYCMYMFAAHIVWISWSITITPLIIVWIKLLAVVESVVYTLNVFKRLSTMTLRSVTMTHYLWLNVKDETFIHVRTSRSFYDDIVNLY